MLIKLVVFLAIGVLVPTCHSFHTFGVNKIDYDDYIGENDIEDNILDLPNASTERDLIDIRPEEALDNDIPDLDDTFKQEESAIENSDTNVLDDDLEPETDSKVETEDKRRETEWDESKSEEDDYLTGIKPTDSTVIEEDDDLTGIKPTESTVIEEDDYLTGIKPTESTVIEEDDDLTAIKPTESTVIEEDDDLTGIKPTESTVIEEVASVDGPLFFFKFHFSNNDLDSVDNKSDEEDSLFHVKFSVNDDDLENIDEKSEEESHSVSTSTDSSVDDSLLVKFPEFTVSDNDLDTLDNNDNNDDFHSFHFKILFNNDDVLVDNSDKVDNENEEESNHGLFGTSFDVEEDAQPDITIITPAEVEPQIEEDDEYFRFRQYLEALDTIQQLESALEALLKEKSTTEKGPVNINNYWNQKHYDMNAYEADLFKERSGYSDNFGYFGRVPEPASYPQMQSNAFEDHRWHKSPVYRPYAMRYRKYYE